MADPFHHAVSSTRKWGGCVTDTLPIHYWFDATKQYLPDFRHRALRHHAEGIGECIERFGRTITLHLDPCPSCNGHGSSDTPGRPCVACDGRAWPLHTRTKTIPTRWVCEQHVTEDLGRIPTASDWLRCMRGEPWMTRNARKLSRELEQQTTVAA